MNSSFNLLSKHDQLIQLAFQSAFTTNNTTHTKSKHGPFSTRKHQTKGALSMTQSPDLQSMYTKRNISFLQLLLTITRRSPPLLPHHYLALHPCPAPTAHPDSPSP